ncbi:hypothetical protein TcasGA2_TC016362 [Tribolium castaneum]|uniref:Uncharacterized protein n=1 Tax=Tribolium castaneum TaxID=7070 RepID=D6WPA5_TRICA|nr:hypothetical protein TcasGA2_TC016362 [Tribolium castaneum]
MDLRCDAPVKKQCEFLLTFELNKNKTVKSQFKDLEIRVLVDFYIEKFQQLETSLKETKRHLPLDLENICKRITHIPGVINVMDE